MKTLKIKFIGEFSAINELIEEVNNIGHEITALATNEDIKLYDYILFFEIKEFLSWAKEHNNYINKAIVCNNNDIILLKNENEGYELAAGADKSIIQVDIDTLVDIIITLSQENYSSWELVPLKIDQFLNVDNKEQITLSSENYQKIIYNWNQTNKEYPSEKTIHQLFEEQVERTADHIGLIYEDIQLSYHEINTRANQLAHYLRHNYHIQGDV